MSQPFLSCLRELSLVERVRSTMTQFKLRLNENFGRSPAAGEGKRRGPKIMQVYRQKSAGAKWSALAAGAVLLFAISFVTSYVLSYAIRLLPWLRWFSSLLRR